MENKLAIEVELNTKKFDKQIAILERQLNDYVSDLEQMSKEEGFDEQSQEVLDLQKNIETLINKLIALKQKKEDVENAGKGAFVESLKNIGNQTENIIKKVARWGLAIFGIRSAYLAVRQAMSTLSQYDKQIGTDIQYIKFVIANELKPVIEAIIKLAYTLLTYIAYIAKAWFGVTLFANSSAKAFQKVNSGVKDTSKSAKQLQKTLAGFDEMNILQDTGSTSTGGGGGGGVGLPTQDLSDLSKIEIPHWLEVLGENGNTIIDIIKGIGIAFATWKITELVFGLSGIGTSLPAIVKSLATMSGLQIFGIISGVAIAVVGIYNTIKNLITWIGDPTWENFEGVLSGLETVLVGVGIAMMTINSANPIGWITYLIGVIPLVSKWLQSLTETEEEHVKTTLSMKEAEDNLTKTRNALNSTTQNYKKAVEDANKAEKELEKAEKKHKISGEDLYKQVLNGDLTYQSMNKSQKAVYEAYLNNLEAQGNLKVATDKMTQAVKDERQAQEDLSVSTFKYKGQYSDYIKTIIDGYEKNKIGAKEMAEKIMYAMSEMDKSTREKFAENLPQNIKDGFATAQKEAGYGIQVFENGVEISFKEIANAGKNSFTDLFKTFSNTTKEMSKQFNTTIPNSVQKSIDKVSKLTQALSKISGGKAVLSLVSTVSGKGNAKGAIYYPPKLAVGGIINQPGRGVPLAMGGERGAEGVIPLTDSAAMSTLGQTIAKYLSINLNNTVQMNGRVISRELKQIQNDDDFAFNGG